MFAAFLLCCGVVPAIGVAFGGRNNNATGLGSVSISGLNNEAINGVSVVVGGADNCASGFISVAVGGLLNNSTGNRSGCGVRWLLE